MQLGILCLRSSPKKKLYTPTFFCMFDFKIHPKKAENARRISKFMKKRQKCKKGRNLKKGRNAKKDRKCTFDFKIHTKKAKMQQKKAEMQKKVENAFLIQVSN